MNTTLPIGYQHTLGYPILQTINLDAFGLHYQGQIDVFDNKECIVTFDLHSSCDENNHIKTVTNITFPSFTTKQVDLGTLSMALRIMSNMTDKMKRKIEDYSGNAFTEDGCAEIVSNYMAK